MGDDGHDERFRDAVCDACDELLIAPLSADVKKIARTHGLRVDSRFRVKGSKGTFDFVKQYSDQAAALAVGAPGEMISLCSCGGDSRAELDAALSVLADRLRAGESLRLLCWCASKRCHGDEIARRLRRDVGEDLVSIVSHPIPKTSTPSTASSTVRQSQSQSQRGSVSKKAWPGGKIVTSDRSHVMHSLIKRKAQSGTVLSDDQARAAAGLGVVVPEETMLPSGWSRDSSSGFVIAKRQRCVTFNEQPTFYRDDSDRSQLSFFSEEDKKAAKRSRQDDEPDVKELGVKQHSIEDARLLAEWLQERLTQDHDASQHHLHLGSSRPHEADGHHPDFQRQDRWAHAGSLRHLEPELDEVLAAEPLPRCNIPSKTDPEPAPEPRPNPPGPFTTAQLIPDDVVANVKAHGRRIADLLKRAKRGSKGAKVARGLRPEALIYEEHEALHPCGFGWTWRKREDQDLWDAVQPSSARDPPSSDLRGKVFAADAKRLDMIDKQVVSWALHGFPGAVDMPTGRAVLGYPHAGAIKNAEAFEEINQRDIKAGFVSSGHEFPEFWPCVVDPMNIVVQHDKPRATIDKTMQLSSSSHPEPVKAFNDYVDLEEERRHVPFKLVRVWQLSRAAAILLTAGVQIKLGKFDLSAYFRMHGKQRLHVYQSGRLLETLFGFDYRVNFGERHAPDHTCRASDALAFFVRVELRRLGKEYPTKCPKIVEWLAMRLGLAQQAGQEDDPDFVWLCLFFFIYYVDDAGLAAFSDLLFNTDGSPVLIAVTAEDGTVSYRQQTRDVLYFEAALKIVQRYGHLTPEKKQSPMNLTLEFLGISLDLRLLKRLITSEKRKAYLEVVKAVLASKQNPNGTLAVAFDDVNSMVHKLLHASEVIPIGRAHLFHTRAALRAGKKASSTRHTIFLGEEVCVEMRWWQAQLEDEIGCEQHGVPFAVRFNFPTSSDTTVIAYGDASREVDNLKESGFGAWSVIDGVFVYIEGRWTAEEIARYSINVLEAFTRDVSTYRFIRYAREQGFTASHSLAFTDNSTAESIAEFGRTDKPGLFALNARRQAWLIENGVFQANERVASIHNDVADLISRGHIDKALRFPSESGLSILRLHLSKEERDLSAIPPTWA